MIVEVLILAFVAWFFIASSFFYKVYWKDSAKTKAKKMTIGLDSIPYFLLIKKERKLTVWAMQAWAAFVFLLFLIIVRTIAF